MNYRPILGVLVMVFISLIPSPGAAQNNDKRATEAQMKVTIGSKAFTATLYDNATATAFKAMLPLTLDMSDLNGNEKYFHFSTGLPTEDSNPATIHTGDLMIWSSRSLMLFYKSFPTPYSYTKIGRINDAAGLAAALGSKNVKITFELE